MDIHETINKLIKCIVPCKNGFKILTSLNEFAKSREHGTEKARRARGHGTEKARGARGTGLKRHGGHGSTVGARDLANSVLISGISYISLIIVDTEHRKVYGKYFYC